MDTTNAIAISIAWKISQWQWLYNNVQYGSHWLGWGKQNKILHTDSKADFLLLVCQSIIIVEVEIQTSVLIGQQLPLQAKQNTEVAFTAHYPDREPGRLQVLSYLKQKNVEHSRGKAIKYQDTETKAAKLATGIIISFILRFDGQVEGI